MSQQTIHAVCFDLFNTLVSVARVPMEVGAYTADILGVDHDAWNEACFSEHHDICGPSDHFANLKKLAHLLDDSIPEQRIRDAAEARQRRFDHALHNIEERILQGLHALKKRSIALALVSNASSPEVQAWADSPLAPLFDCVVFSCDCGSRKPEAEIYQKACATLSVSPHQCLFVGDGGSQEHFGAHALGMKPILMNRYLRPQQLEKKRTELRGVLVAEIREIEELLAMLD